MRLSPVREDGASAVLVAICLLMLFGAGAVAIDLGSGFETKRDLVPDTDAASLAAANYLLGRPCGSSTAGASGVATTFIQANASDFAGGDTPATTVDCTEKTVTVDYGENAPTTLASTIGFDDVPVDSSTTASFAFIGGGLRPFSVCMEAPEIQAWIFNGDGNLDGQDLGPPASEDTDLGGLPDNPNIHRLMHDKAFGNGVLPDAPCGVDAPGNWGIACFEKFFDGNICNDVGPLVRGGYDGDVDLDGPAPNDNADCDPLTPGVYEDCDGKTGINTSLKDDIEFVTCPLATPWDQCEYQFPILGISSFSGSGTNAVMNPTHFVGVVIRGSKFTGAASTRYIDFELIDLFDSGSTLSTGGLPRLVSICRTDGAPASITC